MRARLAALWAAVNALGPDPVPRPVSGWKRLYKNQTAAPGSVAERGASRPCASLWSGGGAPWFSTPSHLRSLHDPGVGVHDQWAPHAGGKWIPEGGWDPQSMANLQRVVVQRRLPGADSRFKRPVMDLLALVRDGEPAPESIALRWRHGNQLERVAGKMRSNSAKLAVTTLGSDAESPST